MIEVRIRKGMIRLRDIRSDTRATANQLFSEFPSGHIVWQC